MAYTKSAMIEISCLQLVLNDSDRFFNYLVQFIRAYAKTFSFLKLHKDKISCVIRRFFTDSDQQSQYLDFFNRL